MPELRLPEGRYLSCNVAVRTGTGGQTRAMLQRNRIFHEEAGVSPAILAFEPAADYAERRRVLIEDNLITEDMCLLNMYDYYHAGSAALNEPLGEELAKVSDYATTLEHYPDGSPFRTVYADRLTGQPVGYDYHRSDGSVFARTAARGVKSTMDGGPPARLVNPDGEVARAFSTMSDWYKHWLQELTQGDKRVFAFMDSRFVLPHLVPIRCRRFYMIYVLHNLHLGGEMHWNSEIPPVYQNVFKRIRHLDALVTLTARQREDLAQRFGATSNLFVVPNFIRQPVRPDPLPPRDPHRLAAVGRLAGQKGFDDAIRAMAIIRERVPSATLDIYGEGSQREALTKLIARLHLTETVTLRGHVAGVQDRLWTATALLMPSRFEGYPLASLESLAHGCPVIAYDIKYGPREQISPGLDGFLVPAGDFRALAQRATEVLTDPDLAARLSAGALRKAEMHGPAAFVADWLDVLQGVLALRSSRTHIRKVSFKVKRLGARRSWKLLARWLAWLPATRRLVASSPTQITFAATLSVDGRSAKATLQQAVIRLDAISEEDGAVTAVPLTVRWNRHNQFRLSSSFDLADVLASLGPQVTSVQLRLRLTWQNSNWETFLRPEALWSRHESNLTTDAVGGTSNSLPTGSLPGMQVRSRLTPWQWARLVGNLVNLTTPIGLLVALVGGARIRRGPRGLFLGEGYRLKFPVAGAFTIGSVITTSQTWAELLRRNPQLFDHEERHTWQYLWCLGLPFYPAYGVCLVWSVLRTGDRAARNFFERNAGLASGGYRDKPVRPIGQNLQAVIAQLRTRQAS